MKLHLLTWVLGIQALLLLAPSGGAQLSPQQLLPGNLALQPSAGAQVRPEIAAGGAGFLVVFEDQRAGLSGTVATNGYGLNPVDLLAMRLDAAGNPMDAAPLVISAAPFEQQRAKVAWNGSMWLVVWEGRRVQQFTTTVGIYAARVSPAGALLDALPILIDDDDSVEERFPKVTANANGWAVTWDDYDPASSLSQVRAALVEPSGLVLVKKTLASASLGFLLPTNSDIAFAQGRYLLTSEHYPPAGGSSSWDVFGRLFNASLDPIGPEFLIDGSPASETKSRIATNGQSFYVVYNGDGVRGTPVGFDGTVAIPGGWQLTAGGQLTDAEPRVAWTGSDWVVVVDEFGFSQWEVVGLHIDAAGTPTGNFVIESQIDQVIDSVIAQGPTPGSGAIVWTDSRLEYADIYGRSFSAGGLTPTVPISVSTPQQVQADLAGGLAHGYLAVFLERTSGSSRILAQRLDGLGAPIDAEPFQLAQGLEGSVLAPRVAFDGTRWLAVWERHYGSQPVRIEGRRVERNGTLPDFLPLDIVAGNTPDVAPLGGHFLVVSSHEPTNHFRVIRSQRVDSANGLLLGGMQTVSDSYSLAPRVEALGQRWLVAWQRHPTHDNPSSRVMAAFVDAAGSPAPFAFIESSPSNARAPAVARVGNLGVIAWNDASDARARRVLEDGTLLDAVAGTLLSSASNSQFGVEIAGDGVRFLSAWTDYRVHTLLEAGLGDVFATRLTLEGLVLDPSGVAVGNDPYSAEGDPAVAGDHGVGVYLFADFRADPVHAGWRLAVRTTSEGTLGTPGCAGTPATCPCGNGGASAAGCINQTGVGSLLQAYGSASVAQDDLVFLARDLPPAQVALLFHGPALMASSAPFGDGQRCVAAPVVRYNLALAAPTGVATWGPALGASGSWTPGIALHFQAWYRDPAGPCGGGVNLTSSVSVLMQP